jgi:protein-tyrosine phosphatase
MLVDEMDATELLPGLWIGSAPETGPGVAHAGFHSLVLCAEEYQPRSREFPGLRHVLHAPLQDHIPTGVEIDTALEAAMHIADMHAAGERILVTCLAGRNRSGLVCALAIVAITGARPLDAAMLVRMRRRGPDGMPALTNPAFIKFLRDLQKVA